MRSMLSANLKDFPDGNSANEALHCIRLGLHQDNFRLGDKVQL